MDEIYNDMLYESCKTWVVNYENSGLILSDDLVDFAEWLLKKQVYIEKS